MDDIEVALDVFQLETSPSKETAALNMPLNSKIPDVFQPFKF